MDIRKIRGKGAVMGPLHLQVKILENHKYKAEIFEGNERKAVGNEFTSMEAAQFWAAGTARAIAPDIAEPLRPWEKLTEG